MLRGRPWADGLVYSAGVEGNVAFEDIFLYPVVIKRQQTPSVDAWPRDAACNKNKSKRKHRSELGHQQCLGTVNTGNLCTLRKGRVSNQVTKVMIGTQKTTKRVSLATVSAAKK